jgi:hypothetical protein
VTQVKKKKICHPLGHVTQIPITFYYHLGFF